VHTRTAQLEVCSVAANGASKSGTSAVENFIMNQRACIVRPNSEGGIAGLNPRFMMRVWRSRLAGAYR